MSLRMRIGLAVLWVVSLAAVGLYGQGRSTVPLNGSPTIISGGDLGFRIDGQADTGPTGKLMIRVKGQWFEATITTGGRAGITPLTMR